MYTTYTESMMLSIFTNKNRRKIKMDSYDVHVHSIQFQYTIMNLFEMFEIIKGSTTLTRWVRYNSNSK